MARLHCHYFKKATANYKGLAFSPDDYQQLLWMSMPKNLPISNHKFLGDEPSYSLLPNQGRSVEKGPYTKLTSSQLYEIGKGQLLDLFMQLYCILGKGIMSHSLFGIITGGAKITIQMNIQASFANN